MAFFKINPPNVFFGLEWQVKPILSHLMNFSYRLISSLPYNRRVIFGIQKVQNLLGYWTFCGGTRIGRQNWLGMKDLNPHKQSQSLSCCHYTNPQYFPVFCNGSIIAKTHELVKYIFAKRIAIYTLYLKKFAQISKLRSRY